MRNEDHLNQDGDEAGQQKCYHSPPLAAGQEIPLHEHDEAAEHHVEYGYSVERIHHGSVWIYSVFVVVENPAENVIQSQGKDHTCQFRNNQECLHCFPADHVQAEKKHEIPGEQRGFHAVGQEKRQVEEVSVSIGILGCVGIGCRTPYVQNSCNKMKNQDTRKHLVLEAFHVLVQNHDRNADRGDHHGTDIKGNIIYISFSFEGSIIYCDIKDDCLVEIFYQNMK